MRHKLVTLLLSVAVIVSLMIVGCAPEAAPPEEGAPPEEEGAAPPAAPEPEVITWKFQSHHTPGALSVEYVIPPFIERLREMSAGRLDIELYYAGELVDYAEVWPALQQNTIQIANTGGLFWRGAVPVGWLGAANLPPFITRSNEEFNELYHHRGLDDLMKEGWREQGIYFLGSHNVGNTYFWSRYPIQSVDELEGFKVRFFGAMSDCMEHFGAAPVMLPHPETYPAIAAGTLDGSGTCWWLYRDLKLYEVCPYFIGPPWQVPQAMELFVSLEAWNALPDDIKAMVETASIAFNKEYADVCWMQEREMFHDSFPEWGTTYIEWGEEDVERIINEFSLPYLDMIDEDIGSQDPRVAQAIEIVKQFMRDYGYLD